MDAKKRWPLCTNIVFRHEYYLKLPKPLHSGHSYRIHVQTSRPDPRFRYVAVFHYDEGKTTSKVIKINQVGYSSVAARRYAYLGWWAGDMGAIDYRQFKEFQVVDELTGNIVLRGPVTLRKANDSLSGESVWQMDLSTLKPGRYHIRIPHFCRSETFHIGGQPVFEMFYHTTRAFFHQRCGQAFHKPWTRFAKPACHVQITRSGNIIGEGSLASIYHKYQATKNLTSANEPVKTLRGGYHDAADFDTFSYHLPATSQLLAVWEMYPQAFTDGQLNIPESNNGIPDILDEARWGLLFYLEKQYPNGSIPLGRINLCDARRQNIEGEKKAPMPPFGIIPPRRASTPVFAAVAAHFARCVRDFDKAAAERHLAAAEKAFAFAATHTAEEEWKMFYTPQTPILHPDKRGRKNKPGSGQQEWLRACTWAAAELYKTTREPKYHDYVKKHYRTLPYWNANGIYFWAYLTTPAEMTDHKIRAFLLSRLLHDPQFGADRIVDKTEQPAYRMGNGESRRCGWGACQAANHGDILLRAYYLTGEKKYLTAACLNADWHLGANPLSKTLVSHMGYRYPRRPEISWFLYEKHDDNDPFGQTVRGYSVYGMGPPLKAPYYPTKPWPLWRSWRDVWDRFAEIYSEFTIHQTIGPAAMLYATLYAIEKKNGTIPDDVKPKAPQG